MNRGRILIVEDEALVAADLEDSLSRLGFEVVGIADNASDALRITQRDAPDLALLDIHIRGDMDGVGLAEHIDVPVVFVTAHADVATLERASRTAPFGYVLKPFDERELQATLEIALSRHKAEVRLRKLEGWLATTLRTMSEGIIACDCNLRVTFMNEAGALITGWTQVEALGSSLRDVLDLVFEDDTQSLDGMVRELLLNAPRSKPEPVSSGASELKRKDGTLCRIKDRVSLVLDDSGLSTGLVVVFRQNLASEQENTRRSQHEFNLIEAQRLETLGLLAGGVAHQINNLLTAVLSNTLLCGMEVESASGRESMEAIEAAGRRAAALCNQVLTYSAQAPGEFQVLGLERVVEQAAQLLRMALPRSTQLSLDLDAGGAPLMLDPVLMRQLLITLVVQASDALQGRSGNVTLNLRTLDVDAANAGGFSPEAPISAGKYVCLELIESVQARVPAAGRGSVEAYFSGRRSRGRALDALRSIVAVHGGTLAVRAQGEGRAVLSLLFPVHRAQVGAAVAGGQPKRVLVADDDRSVRLMLTRMLQGLGFDVEAVETGQDAVEAVQREPARYALVFLDLAMPRLGGVKAHEQIQVIAPTLPVALMSGYHENAARQVLGQGFTTFLQKPFTRADLNRKLQEALGTQG